MEDSWSPLHLVGCLHLVRIDWPSWLGRADFSRDERQRVVRRACTTSAVPAGILDGESIGRVGRVPTPGIG
ncbi:MAG: hypothetical protein DMF90_18170 [Acidobacteria bacterium]|nr:MAG: hypothetical protein DMF90_18170 [Acidobacteriota bacterium]